jgi:hypothetical protein
VIGAVGAPERSPDGYLGVFFTRSAASRQAGVETHARDVGAFLTAPAPEPG